MRSVTCCGCYARLCLSEPPGPPATESSIHTPRPAACKRCRAQRPSKGFGRACSHGGPHRRARGVQGQQQPAGRACSALHTLQRPAAGAARSWQHWGHPALRAAAGRPRQQAAGGWRALAVLCCRRGSGSPAAKAPATLLSRAAPAGVWRRLWAGGSMHACDRALQHHLPPPPACRCLPPPLLNPLPSHPCRW